VGDVDDDRRQYFRSDSIAWKIMALDVLPRRRVSAPGIEWLHKTLGNRSGGWMEVSCLPEMEGSEHMKRPFRNQRFRRSMHRPPPGYKGGPGDGYEAGASIGFNDYHQPVDWYAAILSILRG